MKSIFALSALAGLLLLAGCGGTDPERPDNPAQPGGTQRPGTDSNQPGGEEAFLADTVWRFAAPGLELRYDRPGTLVAVRGDTTLFADLDGVATATFVHGPVAPDSTCAAYVATSSGTELRATARRVKATPRADYYTVRLDTARVARIVVPRD